MNKKQKRVMKIVIISITIILLIIALFGSGVIGNYLKNINLYLFGGTYYWIDIWLLVYAFTFLLNKKSKKKIMKYIYALLLVFISFDFLINFIILGQELSFSLVQGEASVNNLNAIGLVQTTILTILHAIIGFIGIFIVFIIIFLIGVSLVLDLDVIMKKVCNIIVDKYKLRKDKKELKEEKLNEKEVETEDAVVKLVSKEKKYFFDYFYGKLEKPVKKSSVNKFADLDVIEHSKTEKINKKNSRKSKKRSQESIFESEMQIKGKADEKNIIDKMQTTGSLKVEKNYKSKGQQKKYFLPSTKLLKSKRSAAKDTATLNEKAKEKGQQLIKALRSFKLNVKIKNILVGPTITKYELEPEVGVKVSKFSSLSNDLAMSLAAKTIRIEAPIPGKSLIGVEIPNEITQTVLINELFTSSKNDLNNKLSISLGASVSGEPVFLDLTTTPHLLVAGSTGSGKSVCINSIIMSILMKASPEEVKLLLIDPKKVELTPYNGIPHLLRPVITDVSEASVALEQLTHEMEKRYDLFSETKTRNIKSFNKYAAKKDNDYETLPYIVAIIDELADLMMVVGRDIETSIARLAQMARAAGIHLVIATQRPSTDIITGLIKANIPSRISFLVSSSIDSRTVLDSTGAEKLLGKGDMLLSKSGSQSLERIQGVFINDKEISKVVDYILNQVRDEEISDLYDEKFVNLKEKKKDTPEEVSNKKDQLYANAVELAIQEQKITTSFIQRKLKVGYNRACNLMETLENEGVVKVIAPNKREVVFKDMKEYNERKNLSDTE